MSSSTVRFTLTVLYSFVDAIAWPGRVCLPQFNSNLLNYKDDRISEFEIKLVTTKFFS
jgi:hypothetical protein